MTLDALDFIRGIRDTLTGDVTLHIEGDRLIVEWGTGEDCFAVEHDMADVTDPRSLLTWLKGARPKKPKLRLVPDA